MSAACAVSAATGDAMILDTLKLEGKVAIITGAGRGLGRAMAVKFAQAGADIVAASRTKAQLDETAEEVKKTGRKCVIVPTDVTASTQVNALAELTMKEFGKIDILINNAGGGEDGAGKRLEEITDEEWRRGLDTNLSSQFYRFRAWVPQMVKRNRADRSHGREFD